MSKTIRIDGEIQRKLEIISSYMRKPIGDLVKDQIGSWVEANYAVALQAMLDDLQSQEKAK